MIKTKYCCDKCNKEVDNYFRDLTRIEIIVRSSYQARVIWPYPTDKIELCNTCLGEIGFDLNNNSIPKFNLLKSIKQEIKLLKQEVLALKIAGYKTYISRKEVDLVLSLLDKENSSEKVPSKLRKKMLKVKEYLNEEWRSAQ